MVREATLLIEYCSPWQRNMRRLRVKPTGGSRRDRGRPGVWPSVLSVSPSSTRTNVCQRTTFSYPGKCSRCAPFFPTTQVSKTLLHLLVYNYVKTIKHNTCPPTTVPRTGDSNEPILREFILTVTFFRNHPRNPRLIVYVRTPLPFSKPRGRAYSTVATVIYHH